MASYYASRTLMALCLFLAVRASLWAAVEHTSVLPVVMWMVAALMAWSLCPESYEEQNS